MQYDFCHSLSREWWYRVEFYFRRRKDDRGTCYGTLCRHHQEPWQVASSSQSRLYLFMRAAESAASRTVVAVVPAALMPKKRRNCHVETNDEGGRNHCMYSRSWRCRDDAFRNSDAEAMAMIDLTLSKTVRGRSSTKTPMRPTKDKKTKIQ